MGKSEVMAEIASTVAQSAVLAYRRGKKGLEVLLVTSRRTRRWVLPKGNVEDGMTAAESAAKEAYEEAGVKGKVAKRELGSYRYLKPDEDEGQSYAVRVFPMEVTAVKSSWPEKDERRREWMPVETAAKMVHEKKLRKILLNFPKIQKA